MDQIKTQPHQSLLDIAVQHLGGVDGALSMAFANGVSITDDLATGTELKGVEKVEKRTAEVFGNMLHQPATALSPEDEAMDGGFRVFDDTFTTNFE